MRLGGQPLGGESQGGPCKTSANPSDPVDGPSAGRMGQACPTQHRAPGDFHHATGLLAGEERMILQRAMRWGAVSSAVSTATALGVIFCPHDTLRIAEFALMCMSGCVSSYVGPGLLLRQSQ